MLLARSSRGRPRRWPSSSDADRRPSPPPQGPSPSVLGSSACESRTGSLFPRGIMAGMALGGASRCRGTLLGAGDAAPGTRARPSASLAVRAAGPRGRTEQPLDHMAVSERQPGEAMPSALQGCHRRPRPRGAAGGLPAPAPAPSPHAAAPQTRRPSAPRGYPGCAPRRWGRPLPGGEGTARPRAAAPSPPWLLPQRLCPLCHRDGASPSWGLPPKPRCPKKQLPPKLIESGEERTQGLKPDPALSISRTHKSRTMDGYNLPFSGAPEASGRGVRHHTSVSAARRPRPPPAKLSPSFWGGFLH